jgi:cytochrome c
MTRRSRPRNESVEQLRPPSRFGWPAVLLVAGLQACSPPAAKPEAETQPTGAQRSISDPSAYRGAAIAGQVCAQCHDISATPGHAATGAPSFLSVATRPGTTADSLARWLLASHPTMPNYIFDERSVGDIAAYILALAEPRPGDGYDRTTQ